MHHPARPPWHITEHRLVFRQNDGPAQDWRGRRKRSIGVIAMTEHTWSDDQPALPYAGTQGWSGSDTSQERAETEAADGTASQRQQDTLRYLGWRGDRGATYKELGDYYGWHHGQASSVLSVLHMVGRIARLIERRNRCKVYVLPVNVGERATEEHRPNSESTADAYARGFRDGLTARDDGTDQ